MTFASGLATILAEDNRILILRTLHEEALTRTDHIVIITRPHRFILLAGHVPDGDRRTEVHLRHIEITRIGIADEVPTAVMRELAVVDGQRHGDI